MISSSSRKFPAFEGKDLTEYGKEQGSVLRRGNVVDFWFTTCGPCVLVFSVILDALNC